MAIFFLFAGFAAFVVAWLQSIKRQVLNHAPYKMKRQRRHHPIHHTPGGGTRAIIGG